MQPIKMLDTIFIKWLNRCNSTLFKHTHTLFGTYRRLHEAKREQIATKGEKEKKVRASNQSIPSINFNSNNFNKCYVYRMTDKNIFLILDQNHWFYGLFVYIYLFLFNVQQSEWYVRNGIECFTILTVTNDLEYWMKQEKETNKNEVNFRLDHLKGVAKRKMNGKSIKTKINHQKSSMVSKPQKDMLCNFNHKKNIKL